VSDEKHELIGTRIRAERKAKGWTLKRLALAVGVSWQQVQRWEHQDTIQAHRLLAIAKALDVPLSRFLGEDVRTLEMREKEDTVSDEKRMTRAEIIARLGLEDERAYRVKAIKRMASDQRLVEVGADAWIQANLANRCHGLTLSMKLDALEAMAAGSPVTIVAATPEQESSHQTDLREMAEKIGLSPDLVRRPSCSSALAFVDHSVNEPGAQHRPGKRSTIRLTPHEIQSGLDRQGWAEGLILQLPETHEGRNDWLLSYGQGWKATALRLADACPFVWSDIYRAVLPEPLGSVECPYEGIVFSMVPGYEPGRGCPVCKGLEYHLRVERTPPSLPAEGENTSTAEGVGVGGFVCAVCGITVIPGDRIFVHSQERDEEDVLICAHCAKLPLMVIWELIQANDVSAIETLIADHLAAEEGRCVPISFDRGAAAPQPSGPLAPKEDTVTPKNQRDAEAEIARLRSELEVACSLRDSATAALSDAQGKCPMGELLPRPTEMAARLAKIGPETVERWLMEHGWMLLDGSADNAGYPYWRYLEPRPWFEAGARVDAIIRLAGQAHDLHAVEVLLQLEAMQAEAPNVD